MEGDLIKSPSPNTFHQHIIGNIYFIIRRYLDKSPLGEVIMATLDVFLDDINVFQPDLIFISNQRRGIITERGIEGAPDLVVEILSPSTTRLDKGSKRKIYARHGVSELWLVDPGTRMVQIYALAKQPETPTATKGANATFESALLPGIKFKTSAIFKEPGGK